MAYSLITAIPESPIREEWHWETDVTTAFDGSEQTIPLLTYPKRYFSGEFAFDDKQAMQRYLATMFQTFDSLFSFPLFQYQVQLKSSVAVAETVIPVNALRSDFRVGNNALIIEGSNFEIVEVAAISSTEVTLSLGLSLSYTKRAILVPIVEVFSQARAAYTRTNGNNLTSASFTFNESEALIPFKSPLNTETISTFDGMLVLGKRAMGEDFSTETNTGLIINSFLGATDLVAPWTQSKIEFSLTWLCNRALDNSDWLWWVAFANSLTGSETTFLLPSYRPDLEVVTPAAGGGNSVTVLGSDYSDNYWGLDTFARIVIYSSAGRHYAKVTSIGSSGGNDVLTFSPAVPSGSGWATDQQIEFLMKVRNADDKITCHHYNLHSEITMAIRTTE